MAVIPYVQISTDGLKQDSQLSAAIPFRVNANVEAVAGLQVSGCVPFDPAEVEGYATRPTDWLTVAWCLIYSDGGSRVDAEAMVSVSYSSIAARPDVRFRIAVGDVAGPEVVASPVAPSAAFVGFSRIQLELPSAVGVGWRVVELQLQSEAGEVIDTRSITGASSRPDDVIKVGGGSIDKSKRLLVALDWGTSYLGVEDLGSNETRIWPAEQADIDGDVEIIRLGIARVFAFRATVEGRPVNIGTPRPGDLLARSWPSAVTGQVSRIMAQTQRSGVAGRPSAGFGTSSPVPSQRGQAVVVEGGAMRPIGALLLEERDAVEVVVLFTPSAPGSYRFRVLTLDGVTTYADASVVVTPAASAYYEGDGGSVAAWQLREGRTTGLGWCGPGELGRGLRGDVTSGVSRVVLTVREPIDWQSGVVALTAEGPAGALFGVWAVGARTLRPDVPTYAPPQGTRIDETEIERVALATEQPFAELRRDVFSWARGVKLDELQALHRASPLPHPIAWSVDAFGDNAVVTVDWYDETDTLAFSGTVTLTAPGLYRQDFGADLIGDERYRLKVSATGAGGVSAVRIYERTPDPEPEVITFGDALADVLTYADLPTTLAEGATARHYTQGSHYRLWKGGAIPVWVPSRVYGVDGSTLALTAYILGTEANAGDLSAHGWPTISTTGDANVGVVYETNAVLLKCSGAAGLTAPVVGASNVTIVADTSTPAWSGTTRWWAYSDSVVVSAVSNSHARWARARDGARNLGVGSNGGGATTYFDWANNLRSGFAHQVSFIGLANAVASTRREYEFIWEGNTNERTEMAMGFAPQGGIARTAMTTDTNALAFTVRAEAANNLRTNLRIFRYYLVTW